MEYILTVLFALAIPVLFKFQKVVNPAAYFVFSDMVGENINFSLLVARQGVIFVANIIMYVVLEILFNTNDTRIIMCVATFLGTLLIIWPIIIAPRNNLLEYPSVKSILLLFMYYVTFIATSTGTAYMTYYFGNLILSDMSIKEYVIEHIIPIIGSALITLSFGRINIFTSEQTVKSIYNDRDNNIKYD
ncbi:hypothetical protein [Staphylococcus felis]|uniref:hypothetical protein n=1 Tax=Staphylococcus felis TaxID=46127 RepID=UPI002480A063|nr:hypothetical protein [Staphylococcus felis]